MVKCCVYETLDRTLRGVLKVIFMFLFIATSSWCREDNVSLSIDHWRPTFLYYIRTCSNWRPFHVDKQHFSTLPKEKNLMDSSVESELGEVHFSFFFLDFSSLGSIEKCCLSIEMTLKSPLCHAKNVLYTTFFHIITNNGNILRS